MSNIFKQRLNAKKAKSFVDKFEKLSYGEINDMLPEFISSARDAILNHSHESSWANTRSFYEEALVYLVNKKSQAISSENLDKLMAFGDNAFDYDDPVAQNVSWLCTKKLFDKVKTPMLVLAKRCGMEWNGMSGTEAMRYAITTSPEEIKKEYGFKNSVDAGLRYIFKEAGLTDLQANMLIYHGGFANDDYAGDSSIDWANSSTPEMEQVSNYVFKLSSRERAELTLNAVEKIHNQWIADNGHKFDRNNGSTMWQHMPLEAIGFKEVEKDLLFISQFYEQCVDEQTLKDLYFERQKAFLSEYSTFNDLIRDNLPDDGRMDKAIARADSDLSTVLSSDDLDNLPDNSHKESRLEIKQMLDSGKKLENGKDVIVARISNQLLHPSKIHPDLAADIDKMKADIYGKKADKELGEISVHDNAVMFENTGVSI